MVAPTLVAGEPIAASLGLDVTRPPRIPLVEYVNDVPRRGIQIDYTLVVKVLDVLIDLGLCFGYRTSHAFGFVFAAGPGTG
ncbi:hypothetical protein [Streptomyces sp. NRRL F-5123]|uniref:hypothetical protein n=1 Tax=Streptomyces sp. NRRL F-5123 TaxID=1463856 RepID=UPI00131D3142|nr:hypothetical protein [Streptomyces sp. NRRL F-5123]